MDRFIKISGDFMRDESGLTMVEYVIVGASIAAVVAGGFAAIGDAVSVAITGVSDRF